MFVLAAASGCHREEIQVYRVAKEPGNQPAVANPHASNVPGDRRALPKLGWKLPAGWLEQAPSSMRVASFAVSGPEGQKADVAVIPLPGVTGRALDMVNMWRGQVRLEPVQSDELERLVTKATVGSTEAKFFDMANPTLNSQPSTLNQPSQRVLVAVLERDGTSWFFKMTGPAVWVESQKTAFLEFLKSIEFLGGGKPTDMLAGSPQGTRAAAQTAPAGDPGGKPQWIVPAGWQEAPPPQFLVAKFLVGAAGARAEIAVSRLEGAGGGLLGNVNRWRGQLGLDAVTEVGLARFAKSVDVTGGQATLVDLSGTDARTGQPARLMGAVVTQPGEAWFYKLMGDPKIVESQAETFTKFVQSVKY